MANYKCENCPMRVKYEKNPKSFIGRFWRWHINICPGWKSYFNTLTPTQKQELRDKYHFTKL